MLWIGDIKIEIAAQQAGSRQGPADVWIDVFPIRHFGTRRSLLLQIKQSLDLCHALRGGIIFKMGIDDPQRPKTSLHRDVERLATHAALSAGLRGRKKMACDLQYRQARKC